MKDKSKYLEPVKIQYENFPYPLRDPQYEKKRFIMTDLDSMEKVNYYCFEGKQKFNGFRVLVAGCGTGDAVICWAEQLKDFNATVYALDMSTESLNIAKERAKVRGLKNINWLQESILNLPDLDLEPFDYINCCGVLHHLECPSEGLAALKSVLKPEGSIGLMVYAKYGRTAVYQIQDLMRLFNQNTFNLQDKVDNTKVILNSLPQGSWWKRSEDLISDVRTMGDVGIYDLFLHSHDVAYSIPELYKYVEDQDFKIIEFSNPADRLALRLEFYIREAKLLEQMKSMDLKTKQAIAEIMNGSIIKHACFISAAKPQKPSLLDLENIPYLVGFSDEQQNLNFAAQLIAYPGKPLILRDKDVSITINPKKYTYQIFKYMDGKRSLKNICDFVRKELKENSLSNEEIISDFEDIFNTFSSIDRLFLRHSTTTQPKNWKSFEL